MFIVVSRFPFTSKKCIIIIYIFRMARYNSHPNWHENLEQWTSQRSNWGMVDVLWLEQRSVPIFGSKGHCLFIQGKGVSREAGNTTTNIQNLNYPCRTDIPHLSCHISQLELTTLFTCIYDQNQHIDPDTKYRSHKFTHLQIHIHTHTCMFVYIDICVCVCVCSVYIV